MSISKKLLSFFKRNKPNPLVSNFELEKLNKLSQKINIQFGDNLLYAKALTHRSYLDKVTILNKSNERLEFLGDAVLGLIVAETLFTRFPDNDEGFLTKSRSHIVDKNALFEAAMKLGLNHYILYDERFIKNSEEGIKTILSDCLEALIGAIYLDKGIGEVKKFILNWIATPNLDSGKYQIDNNYKGQLLEYSHSEKLSHPNYVLVNSIGPDHKKEFIVQVLIDDKFYGQGQGKNKKSAEQQAAKSALRNLKK
jgi:ribonuclease-3